MRIPRVVPWLLAFLLVLETGLEIRAHRRGFDTILFGRTTADASATGDDAPADAFGPTPGFPFRSRVTGREPAPGTFRIWLASASFAEDVYLPAERIFPVLAAAELSRPRRPVEILNASRAGNTIGSNVLFLQQEGAAWHPRAAVLYQMSLDINDLTARLLGGAGAVPTPGAAGGEEAGPAESDGDGAAAAPGPNPLVRFYESTTTYQVLKEAVAGRLTGQRLLADGLGPEAPALFRDRVLDFVAAARAAGAEPVLCTFATAYDADNWRQMPASARNSLFRYNIHLSLRGWVDTVDALNAVLAQVAADEDLVLIDIAAALRGRPEHFRDFVHFNAEGHRAMAQALAAGLEPYLAARGDGDGAGEAGP